MSWYQWRWWRLAFQPHNREHVVSDVHGQWHHVLFGLWVRTGGRSDDYDHVTCEACDALVAPGDAHLCLLDSTWLCRECANDIASEETG